MLKRLPLDQLKIDQGFVRHIVTDTNDAAIAKMVVVLAENPSGNRCRNRSSTSRLIARKPQLRSGMVWCAR